MTSTKTSATNNPEEQFHIATAAVAETGGNVSQASLKLGIPRTTLRRWLSLDATVSVDTGIEYPPELDDDLPIEQVIDIQKRRFVKRHEYVKSKRWFPVKINIDGPIGVSFFGDPHVDDNGCNWPLLEHHCDLHRKTDALFGVTIGDATNNWVGRLGRLFAEQETSQATARKLAKWLLADSGITWACWLMGNHDLWNEGAEILRGMNATSVPMEDWSAKFTLVLPKVKIRIWASHQFPGNSQWNTLHGLQKAASMKEMAHLYVAGHIHQWGMHQEESADRDFVYWLLRARGYKFIDKYAELLGHESQQEGAAITAIINPDATNAAALIQCYADMDAAADYLSWLRQKQC